MKIQSAFLLSALLSTFTVLAQADAGAAGGQGNDAATGAATNSASSGNMNSTST